MRLSRVEMSESQNRQGYVYCIGAGGLVKIGRSQKPFLRVESIICASPHDVKVLFLFACAVDEMAAAEKELHSRFATNHIRREWYALRGADLDWLHSNPLPTKIDMAHSTACPCCSAVPYWNGARIRTTDAVERHRRPA